MSCNTTSTTYNMKITQGDILKRSFIFNNADETAYNLGQYTEIAMQVRKRPGSDLLAEALLSDGGFTVSGTDSNVLNLIGLNMSIDPGMYRYDIEFSNDTARDTLITGTIHILPQITA